MKLPALPSLDDADRKVVGIALVALVAFVLVCLMVGAGLGLGVRAFTVMAGWG